MSQSLNTCFCLLLFIYTAEAQNHNFHVKIPLQFESQKAELLWGPNTHVKGKAINFGVHFLYENDLKNGFRVTAGAGYFRERFNLTRPYNHQLLNRGDSIPLLTLAYNYNYSLLQVPASLLLQTSKSAKTNFFIGIEHIFNFSFLRTYNGGKPPVPYTNTTLHRFNFFGNTLSCFAELRTAYASSTFAVQALARVYNRYRRDRILFEDEDEYNRRNFDAYGIRLTYILPSNH